MKNRILIILLISFSLLGCEDDGDTTFNFDYDLIITEQIFAPLDSIYTINDITMIGHYKYVVDLADYQVKKIDSLGSLIGRVGNRGKGPGEFIQPAKIISSGNSLFVLDNGTHQITVLDENLNFLAKKNDFYGIPFEICSMDDSNFFTACYSSEGFELQIFNLDKNKITLKNSFNLIYSNHTEKIAHFAYSSDSSFIEVPYFSNSIYFRDRSFNLKNEVKLSRLPERLDLNELGVPDKKIVNDIAVTDGFVFILSNYNFPLYSEIYIFNKKDKKYSVKKCTQLFQRLLNHQNIIYALDIKNIKLYKMDLIIYDQF